LSKSSRPSPKNESESDDLRNVLDAARTALQDAATEVRTVMAKMQKSPT
jgi:hypothetical protein